VAVQADPDESFQALMDRLGSGETAESSGEVVGVSLECCSVPSRTLPKLPVDF
jgi:hypothetical protein